MVYGIIFSVIVLLSLLLGAAGYAVGGLFIALPLLIIVLAGGAATLIAGRSVLKTRRHHERMRAFRAQAKARKQDFSSTDRRTLV
jgi:flagellar motor component MotA